MSRVAAIFGSRSVEHEVSVITAQQAMAAMSTAHQPVPVYIAKDGRWFTGDVLTELARYSDVDRLLEECTQVTPLLDPGRPGLRLMPVAGSRRSVFGRGAPESIEADAAMPLVHGTLGEDGTLQGLLEMAGVPYTGCDVAASAIAMDKRRSKSVFAGAGLPVVADVVITAARWEADPDGCLAEAGALGGALFVKPVSLGSSIGVSRAEDPDQLRGAITTALTYDWRCLIEPAQEGIVEINCAVLGDATRQRPSLLEQPTARGLLSYDDKYRGSKGGGKGGGEGMKGAQRLIPAPLPEELAHRIREAAVTAFTAIGAEGVARVDFMVDIEAQTFLVNEINPVPGSLSFYLFEPDGLTFAALIDEMIALAVARGRRDAARSLVFDRWMLDAGGPKSSR